MKRIITMAAMMLSAAAFAGNLFVYAVNGTAEKKDGGSWTTLARRTELKESDVVRVKAGSSLSIIDKGASKIYAVGETGDKTVDAIMKAQNSGGSASQEFVAHAVKSLFSGGAENISHQAAGCTYRGDIIESDIAKAILAKKTAEKKLNLSNEKSDYGITFDIVDRNNGSVVFSAQPGREVFFRIKNTSSQFLYVNIIDVDNNGELSECLPMDDAQTMSHLMIPANSTIDLTDYPIAFTEPLGSDNLLLIASDQPYDLRQVTKFLQNKDIQASGKMKLGVYAKTVAIIK